jgi:hypothetical protein
VQGIDSRRCGSRRRTCRRPPVDPVFPARAAATFENFRRPRPSAQAHLPIYAP